MDEKQDFLRIYLNSLGDKEILTPEEEKELGKNLKQNKKRNKSAYAMARNELIIRNQRLVIGIVKRYQGRGLSFWDLVQEGNMGLMKAIEKWDYKKGWKFGTYATWWIRQAITRALIEQTKTIAIPVYMVDSLNRVNKKMKEMKQEKGAPVSVYEAAKELKISRKKIDLWLSWSQDTVSISTPVFGDDDATIEDFIASDNGDGDPLKILERNDVREKIIKIIKKLPKQEEQVIMMRFGISVDRDHTLEEVGKHLYLSKERVRQIERKALKRLKRLKHFFHSHNLR